MDNETQDRKDLLTTTFEHDLGNLMNLVEGYNELLDCADSETAEQHREKLRNAEESIDDLYDRFEEKTEGYDLGIQELVGESLEMLHQKIQHENKNVEINWETGNEGNYDLLTERMVYNLLDNSLDHGNGDIYIDVTEDNDYIHMTVNDGGNLTEEELEEIFPKKYERDAYRSTGSYIIDRIAERQGIDIEHSSDADYSVKIPK